MSATSAASIQPIGPSSRGLAEPSAPVARWAKLIDNQRCIGCHACSVACKSENNVPLSVNRTYVKYVDVGIYPETRRSFQVTRCNQCAEPPCAFACPTSAMFQRKDGIVDFDKSICIGCKACIAACPYDAIFINPEDNSAEKCNFCAHRLEIGLEPACVVVCPTEAILIGDLDDVTAKLTKIVNRDNVSVRRPEKDTQPKLFYRDAHQATLDPLAARRPEGELYLWSEQPVGDGLVPSGHPGQPNMSAHAMLSFDVPHRIPWGWKVSLYTLTKGMSAGAFMWGAALLLAGELNVTRDFFELLTPVLALLFLGVTGVLLIWDLTKPKLFYMIFTRPQWKSWLVRGSFILAGYGGVSTLLIIAHLTDMEVVYKALLWVGLPLALLSAVYTAFLLAQAKARDLWQSSLLPFQITYHALHSGAALWTLVLKIQYGDRYDAYTLPALAVMGGIHLLLILGEVSLTHSTAHARLALHEMVRGRYAMFFKTSIVLLLLSCLAPWIGVPAVAFALFGLLAFEHAYLQAAQCVPLA